MTANTLDLVAAERERCSKLCVEAMPQPVKNWPDAQIVEALRLLRERITTPQEKSPG